MSGTDILGRVNRLVGAVRATGDLVVWIRHSEPGSGTVFDPVSGFVRLQDDLDPLPGDPQVVKTSVNSFTTTNLHQILTSHGVREVIVCGIRTEQCCETTARVASDLGYAVTFVTDATATSALLGGDGAEILSRDDIVRHTELILAGREFATIATTEQVVDEASATLTGS
jgi:nicotinamidase-related amidase